MKQYNGAIPLHPLHRWFHRKLRKKLPKVAKGLPFNWSIGYDVRDTIGPITIKNQGINDSCGGQAGSYALEILRRLNNIKEGAISAKSIYAPIAYPGGGTTVSALEVQLGTVGANLETAVPSQNDGVPFTEQQITDLTYRTTALTADALTRAGYTPYDIPTDINSIASAVQAYGCVIWEIQGHANPTWAQAYPVYNPPGSGAVFGHFMCIIGAKMINNVPTLIVLESMGVQQGDGGIQYFTQDYFTAGGIKDSFTMIADSHIIALPTTMGWWQYWVNFFHQLFAGLTGQATI